MGQSLRIAAAQFPVSADIRRNARYIESQIREGAQRGAQVVLFPESALSGYGPSHFSSWLDFPWDILESQTRHIRDLASSLGLWVAFGSARSVPGEDPRNTLHVISASGELESYDKRRLSEADKKFYSVGSHPLVTEVHGFKCGFLICYDNCFPELYEIYRDMGVTLLFHAFFNAGNRRSTSIKDLMLANLIVRAADNQMWIAAANSSSRYCPLSACIVRPDGSKVHARRHVPSIVIDDYPSASLGWTYDNRTK